MNQDLPIWILEPEQTEKTELTARKLFEGGQKAGRIPETVSVEELKEQIKKVRQYARDNIDLLVKELQTTLSEQYPKVKVKSALDNVEAVKYITEISDGISIASINNSSMVTQELKPSLADNGFTIINSYLHEFDVEKRKILDYWGLPRLFDKNLRGTFDVAMRMSGLPDVANKQYLAILGVNAMSAEDSTAFFLEHFSNIDEDLRLANMVILVVGLDKIVSTRREAAFQTQCMGIFGMESVLLGIGPKSDDGPAIDELPLPVGDKERELHVIILDNGRTKLLEGKFRDLFLCIGCRACNKHCPIHHSLTGVDYIWTPRTYLNQFLYGTGSKSIDICLHCEACHLECPVDIDLPYLMWQAKADYITQYGTPSKRKILGRPELLAKLGTTFAPIANWMMARKLVRIPMEAITGVDRRTSLPRFHSQTFRKWFKKYDGRFDS